MSLKETAEKNSALFVLGLLFAGFIAGIGTHKALLEMVGQKSADASEETLADALADVRQLREENQQLTARLAESQEKVSAAQVAELREVLFGMTAEYERIKKQPPVFQGGDTSTVTLDSGGDGSTFQAASPSVPQRINSFEFILQACQSEGPNITCWVMVTNRDVDRDLHLNRESRIIDQQGEQHQQDARIFGGKDITWLGSFPIKLATDVPTRFGLKFKGISPKVERIALLEVVCNDFSVQWRNIQIQ